MFDLGLAGHLVKCSYSRNDKPPVPNIIREVVLGFLAQVAKCNCDPDRSRSVLAVKIFLLQLSEIGRQIFRFAEEDVQGR